MFLEDELNEIYNKEGVTQDSTFKMIKAIHERTPNPENGVENYVNAVRRNDYIWRSFCKDKPKLNPDGYRLFQLRNLNDMEKAQAIQIFKWY